MNPVLEEDAADVISNPLTERERILCEYVAEKVPELEERIMGLEGISADADEKVERLENEISDLEDERDKLCDEVAELKKEIDRLDEVTNK